MNTGIKQALLEVCCGSAEDVIEAFRAGADRVELNSDLFHGGLTTTVGSLRVAKAASAIRRRSSGSAWRMPGSF